MSLKKKITSAVTAVAALTAALACFNKIITIKSNLEEPNANFSSHQYQSKFGCIHYSVSGNSGKPLLLIHGIHSTESETEWDALVALLAESRMVYTIDLIGCGRSEKPSFTYTNFVFVQLITSFIQDIIGHRTDVVTSRDASSVALMTAVYNSSVFNKLILINPARPAASSHPGSVHQLLQKLFHFPVYGTTLYYALVSKYNLKKQLKQQFHTTEQAKLEHFLLDAYQNAHRGGSGSKYLYASEISAMTQMNTVQAIKKINNSILILGSSELPDMPSILAEYHTLNPSIETELLDHCLDFPAIEQPDQIAEMIQYL